MNVNFSLIKPLNELVSDEDIFSHYLGEEIELGRAYLSPLRREGTPSFALFRSKKGDIRFKDFGNGQTGSAADLVMQLYGLSYGEAINRIKSDILQQETIKKRRIEPLSEPRLRDSPRYRFTIDSRPFSDNDLRFWGQYGIRKQTLLKFDVIPCRRVLVYDSTGCMKSSYFSNSSEPIYAYRFGKQRDYRYKIYRPHSNIKWLTNTIPRDIQGWLQKPKNGTTIIITKSLKDVMVLTEVGLPAIALQSEAVLPPLDLVSHLYKTFQKVIMWYDNDLAGIKASLNAYQITLTSKTIYGITEQNLQTTYECPNTKSLLLALTHCPISKDPSDLVKNHGFLKAKELIQKIISESGQGYKES